MRRFACLALLASMGCATGGALPLNRETSRLGFLPRLEPTALAGRTSLPTSGAPHTIALSSSRAKAAHR